MCGGEAKTETMAFPLFPPVSAHFLWVGHLFALTPFVLYPVATIFFFIGLLGAVLLKVAGAPTGPAHKPLVVS
jgi:hypothetical protein